ncbi:MAG: RpiB/LacA/LacB family sugar-phosphate isomerase [Chthonomonas sp.]|nr:RpiB/LacA/LacB family sugar-phosphate isomerase [Chthonomonas sp.]
MKLVFGSDHAGFRYRQMLAEHARNLGHSVTEVGAEGLESYDYPDASDALAPYLLESKADLGVLICGSGIGVSIRANRYPHIRAALCTTVELGQLARQHNHANVLCLGERIISEELARGIFDAFLATKPDNEQRHEKRVKKLDAPLGC